MPLNMDELNSTVKRASHISEPQIKANGRIPTPGEHSLDKMLRSTGCLRDVCDAISTAAAFDSSLLITGETGTGKELAARAIHEQSPRKLGPFIALNCSGVPEILLERELFGHERGADVGESTRLRSRVEAASGGTLFLNEIAELPATLQSKLFQFLRGQRTKRVGQQQSMESDTRVIAAATSNLHTAVHSGRFLSDLYNQLAVMVLRLPPLNERREEVPVLANFILCRLTPEFPRGKLRLAPDAIFALQRHQWPGNLRELENRMRRAVLMAEDTSITAADLELSVVDTLEVPTLKQARERVERELIRQALLQNRGNIIRTASVLGISRPTLYDLMRKLGIRKCNGDANGA